MTTETTCCVCSAHQALILLLAFLIPVHAHSKAKGQLLSVLAASGEETRLRATVNDIGSIFENCSSGPVEEAS